MISKKTLVDWQEKGLLDSIRFLGDQIESGFSFPVPKFGSINNLYWMGMGGSSLSAWILKFFWQPQLKKPVFIHQQPFLPRFINPKDLLIVSSYSGNTQETISFYQQAVKAKYQILGIVGGGQLEEEFRKNKTPFLKINSCLNPSAQPRMGIGFGLGFLAKIAARYRLVDQQSIKEFRQQQKKFDFKKTVKFKTKTLKRVFSLAAGRIPLFLASSRLEGLAHFYQNQIHENAKQMACFFSFPELNHHLLEGLSRLGRNKNRLAGVILTTGKEEEEERKRIQLTSQLLEKQEIANFQLILRGKSLTEKLFWGISFGERLALLLAHLNRVDPLRVPRVDWFKKQLV